MSVIARDDVDAKTTRLPLTRATLYGFLGQVLLLGSLFVFYRLGRVLSAHDGAVAMQHGLWLWDAERMLRLPNEDILQRAVLDAPHWLVVAANRYYVWMHFPVTGFFTAWLYLHRHDLYKRIRAMLIGVSLPALFLQISFPVAPPRLIGVGELVDTMAKFGPSAYADVHSGLANQYAALPSLHAGWALICAVIAWQMRGHILAKVMTAHLVITTLVVVVTANHYWIDVILGFTMVGVAWFILERHQSRRSNKPQPDTVQQAA